MPASTTAQAAFPVGLQRSSPACREAGSESRAAGLGLEEGFDEVPGILASMLVAFGRSGIRTIEDLAACATDDLLGWTERCGDEVTIHPGILSDMPVSRKQCDAIILQARVRAGWIEATALIA
jgi:transcription termination/antitermination protein NusA